MTPEKAPITGAENRDEHTPARRALIDFYNAFNSRNMEKMARNWANTDDIAMDNPLGGIKRGWDEIRQVYERIFNGPAKVYVEFYDYTIHEGADMFYAVGRERGEFVKGVESVSLSIRTSRVFRETGGRWLQAHHHGSIEDPELLARYQKAVAG